MTDFCFCYIVFVSSPVVKWSRVFIVLIAAVMLLFKCEALKGNLKSCVHSILD